jgi:hypothetical protein
VFVILSYFVCNFVCFVLFGVCVCVILCFLCIVVSLPSGTYPFAVIIINNNNNNNNNNFIASTLRSLKLSDGVVTLLDTDRSLDRQLEKQQVPQSGATLEDLTQTAPLRIRKKVPFIVSHSTETLPLPLPLASCMLL